MSRAHGLTLVEVVVVFFVLVMIVGVLLPSTGGAREMSYRSTCAANLTGIYKSMYTYSVTNEDRFPVAGTADDDGSVIGFREGNRTTGKGAVLDNNTTAALWVLVRDGSTGVGQFICPTSGDEQDTQADARGRDVPIENTFDFTERSTLSFSMINMYHQTYRTQWGSNAPASFVLMGDNNDNDSVHSRRHTLAKGAARGDIETHENSSNHDYEGQNFLFGDSHVSFANDPFVGFRDDNAYARTVTGKALPPRLGNDATDTDTDPDLDKAHDDAVLIPLSGNGGVSLSGLPVTYFPGYTPSLTEPSRDPTDRTIILALIAVSVLAALIAAAARYTYHRRRSAVQ